jgi:hypothetical protein
MDKFLLVPFVLSSFRFLSQDLPACCLLPSSLSPLRPFALHSLPACCLLLVACCRLPFRSYVLSPFMACLPVACCLLLAAVFPFALSPLSPLVNKKIFDERMCLIRFFVFLQNNFYYCCY